MIRVVEIVRGAVTRTLPAVVLGYAVLAAMSTYARAHLSAGTIALAVLAAGAVATGSALTLVLMRTRLRDDTGVAGRRAFVVGLAAFAAAITVRPFLPFVNPAGQYVVLGVSGALLSAAVFFPWLSTAPTDPLASARNEVSAGSLPGGAASTIPLTARERATVRRYHE